MTQKGYERLSINAYFKEVRKIYYEGGYVDDSIENEPKKQIYVSSKLVGNQSMTYDYNKVTVTEKLEYSGKTYETTPFLIEKSQYEEYLLYDMQSMDYCKGIYISEEYAKQIVIENLNNISLVFKNDKEARKQIVSLSNDGYVAIMSDAKTQNSFEALSKLINDIMRFILWIGCIMFIAMFIAICSLKINENGKKDIAIFRTMGIKSFVIKQSILWQNYIAMAIAVILAIPLIVLIYTNPSANQTFMFMNFWQYLAMLIGVTLVSTIVTIKFNRQLFKQSVRKNLKGGRKNDKVKQGQ